MKTCSKCKETKDLSDFSMSKKYGHQAYCEICAKQYNKNYHKVNKPKIREIQKDYQNKNMFKIIEYQNKRYQTNIQYKLSKNLRSRINKAIKRNQKSGSAVRDLGCSIKQFKTYLESKFLIGMNWDNYGEWHIDHIKPLSSFDLSNREELLKACHFTNLQPLWAEDNLRKSAELG